MIFIISREDDVHADMVIRELDILGEKYFRLNTEKICEYNISLSTCGGQITNTRNGYAMDLGDVGSIYLRRRSIPDNLPVASTVRTFTENEWVRLTRNVWSCLRDRYWISSPLAIDRASDKMYQLQIAQRLGFAVPETVMTNDMRSVAALKEQYGDIIYKPFDGGAVKGDAGVSIYTSKIAEEDLGDKESLRVCPGIFQPYIAKLYEVRVTVVGNRVFATKIDSQSSAVSSVDWRRYDFTNVEHSSVVLPEMVARRCIDIVKELGLEFGAIDLIVRPDGEYVFLEINANGQWAWLQLLAGHPIAKTIATNLHSNDK